MPVASPEVSSLEQVVERVRDAISSTEQHTNTALLNSTPRRLLVCLDQVLCPMYTRHYNPMQMSSR